MWIKNYKFIDFDAPSFRSWPCFGIKLEIKTVDSTLVYLIESYILKSFLQIDGKFWILPLLCFWICFVFWLRYSTWNSLFILVIRYLGLGVCPYYGRSLDTKQGYRPPPNARQIILDIVTPLLASSANPIRLSSFDRNLTSTSLDDPKLKYKVPALKLCLNI